MKMRDARSLAESLWRSEKTVEVVGLRRKSPRYRVGYVDVVTGRATILGTSNVDLESAFVNAGLGDPDRMVKRCRRCGEIEAHHPEYGLCITCTYLANRPTPEQ